MLKEFRDFLLRGNIVELAVAFVMGVAFAAVVQAFVNGLIMPLIAAIFGKQNFNDLTFTINNAVFSYGSVITAAIQFVAIAAAVFFFVVKPVNALLRRFRSPVEEGMPDEELRHQELLAALRGRWVEGWETAELLEPYGEWAGLASLYLLHAYKNGLVRMPKPRAA